MTSDDGDVRFAAGSSSSSCSILIFDPHSSSLLTARPGPIGVAPPGVLPYHPGAGGQPRARAPDFPAQRTASPDHGGILLGLRTSRDPATRRSDPACLSSDHLS